MSGRTHPAYIEAQTDDERSALSSAMAQVRSGWGYVRSYGFNDLLDAWQRTVLEVENGYRRSLYDYETDLSLRDEIEAVRLSVPARLASAIQLAVAPLDARFIEATRAVASPLLPAADGESQGPWWFRLPTGVVLREGDDSWLKLIRSGEVEQLPHFQA